jgi:hypothetical protein
MAALIDSGKLYDLFTLTGAFFGHVPEKRFPAGGDTSC